MNNFIEELAAVPAGEPRALSEWYQKFTGSMHIATWTEQAWGTLIRLCMRIGLVPEVFEDRLGIDSDEVRSWQSGTILPMESIRTSILQVIGQELPELAAA